MPIYMVEYIVERTSYYPGTFVLRVVDTIIGIIEAMLGLRLILQLLGANPASQFIAWVYGITDSIIGPFAGAFPALMLGGFVIEFTTIFAMIGYAIIGWLIIRLLSFLFSHL